MFTGGEDAAVRLWDLRLVPAPNPNDAQQQKSVPCTKIFQVPYFEMFLPVNTYFSI
jgi:hypothetical protein